MPTPLSLMDAFGNMGKDDTIVVNGIRPETDMKRVMTANRKDEVDEVDGAKHDACMSYMS